ncbi:penicillin-binding transpeptidase domain-containing protein [Streptomyces sp. NPDC016469]|uniref:penicillin-binding transpeptidase domain-containing protein n=1 Tax=Streptomyces sp. NPDC016469 TaxID=3157191 RepID=UPI0033CE05EC
MPTTKRHWASLAALLTLLVPLAGCGTGGDGGTGIGKRAGASGGKSRDDEQSIPRPPKAGLGDIIVGNRAITGSRPSGNRKVPYRRTYADGELYATVTGYRSLVYGRNELESAYDDVLNPGASSPGSRPGNVVTAISPAVQRAAMDALDGREGAAVAVDVRTGHIRALVSTPSYDPATFSGNSMEDSRGWIELTGNRHKPLLNRTRKESTPPGETFHLVVAAAALEKGLYSSVDEATDTPASYTPPGSSKALTGDPAHCGNASIRTALRYACGNIFARLAVDVGEAQLAATAQSFGFNDDELLIPTPVNPSDYPRGRNAADLAAAANGSGGVTATPVQMARVMAVIAGGGKQVHPQLVTKVVRADGSVEQPKDLAEDDGRRVVGQRTAAQLQSALRTSADGVTGWVRQWDVNSGGESVSWSVSLARSGDEGPMAIAVYLSNPRASSDRADDVALTERVVERMRRAAAASH